MSILGKNPLPLLGMPRSSSLPKAASSAPLLPAAVRMRGTVVDWDRWRFAKGLKPPVQTSTSALNSATAIAIAPLADNPYAGWLIHFASSTTQLYRTPFSFDPNTRKLTLSASELIVTLPYTPNVNAPYNRALQVERFGDKWVCCYGDYNGSIQGNNIVLLNSRCQFVSSLRLSSGSSASSTFIKVDERTLDAGSGSTIHRVTINGSALSAVSLGNYSAGMQAAWDKINPNYIIVQQPGGTTHLRYTAGFASAQSYTSPRQANAAWTYVPLGRNKILYVGNESGFAACYTSIFDAALGANGTEVTAIWVNGCHQPTAVSLTTKDDGMAIATAASFEGTNGGGAHGFRLYNANGMVANASYGSSTGAQNAWQAALMPIDERFVLASSYDFGSNNAQNQHLLLLEATY